MKKNFWDFAGSLFRTSAYVLCCLSLIGLSSCSNDDDEDNEEGKGNKPASGLVSTTIPPKGWSGSTDNGICTYRSDDADEDFPTYYAFAFENGKCTDAVFNIVCENEAMAKELIRILNSGEWILGDDEEEEDYRIAPAAERQNPVLLQALRHSKAIKTAMTHTRTTASNVNVMGLACTLDGRVISYKIESLKGLDWRYMEYVMNSWADDENGEFLPERPLFGTWDETTNKYTNNDIYAIPGSKVEIETAFNSSNILTKYVATYTLSDETYAEAIEDRWRKAFEDYSDLFVITRNGNVVTISSQNIVSTYTTKEALLAFIIAMDILESQPIITIIFFK